MRIRLEDIREFRSVGGDMDVYARSGRGRLDPEVAATIHDLLRRMALEREESAVSVEFRTETARRLRDEVDSEEARRALISTALAGGF